jgi:hypothetical protein
MPDPLAQDDVLSFDPRSPFLTAPGGPVAAPGPPPNLGPQIADERRQAQEAFGAARQSMDREEANAAAREKELAPLRQRQMQMAMSGIDRAEAAQHALETKTQKPPEPPQRQNQHDDENWLFAAGLLGSLAGALTRNHATNALAAFSGALQGYQEGSREKFDQNMKIWEAENKKVIETNKAAQDEYRSILENNKFTMDQISVALQVAGAKYEDRGMVTAAKTKNELVIAQYHDQNARAMEQLEGTFTRLSQANEAMQQRERLAREANQSRIEAARLRASGGGQQSDDAINLRAQMVLEGNPIATRGMRAGTPDFVRVMDRVAEIGKESGMTAAEITRKQTQFAGEQSYQKRAGTTAANVENATNEVLTLAPQAVETSHNLPRGDIVNLNKILQEGVKFNVPTQGEFDVFLGQKQFSDPRYYDFLVSSFSLSTAYGRAMNPQGVPRIEEARTRQAINLLSTAVSPEAYDTQVRRLLLEVKASQQAVAKTREGRGTGEEIDRLIDSLGLKPVQPYTTNADRLFGLSPQQPKAAPPKPSSGANMPMMLPEGWTVKELQ